MNTEIANILKGLIENHSFVDQIAGLVKPLTFQETNEDNTGTVLKIIPVACNLSETECKKKGYDSLVPDSKKKSIIYFEDNGCRFIDKSGKYQNFESNMVLVCWMNLKMLGETTSCSKSYQIIATLLKDLQTKFFNVNDILKLNISVESELIKSAAIFSKYTYREEINQYLLYPYDFFGLNINVNFSINLNCVEDYEAGPPEKCND